MPNNETITIDFLILNSIEKALRRTVGGFFVVKTKFFAKICNELGISAYKLQKNNLEVDNMAEKDKYADKKLRDEELDNVAGGTKMETWRDSDALVKRGFLTHEQSLKPGAVRQKLHELGYTGYIDYGNSNKDCNIYTDKAGNKISRENFWKLFDRENPRDPNKYPLSW